MIDDGKNLADGSHKSLMKTCREYKMLYLMEYAARHKRFRFRNLLEAQSSKMEVIVTFLAVLELMKVGKISIYQEKTFDEIQIESKLVA